MALNLVLVRRHFLRTATLVFQFHTGGDSWPRRIQTFRFHFQQSHNTNQTCFLLKMARERF